MRKHISNAITNFLWNQTDEKRDIFIRRYWYFDSIENITQALERAIFCEKNGQNYIVYNEQIRKSNSNGADPFDGGVLFYIVCYDEAITPEQFVDNGYDFTDYRYLFSTSNNTYILHYASDVQWNPDDSEQEKIYTQMASEIEDIRFVADNALAN